MQFVQTKKRVIRVQSVARALVARAFLCDNKSAATKITASWRRYKAIQKFIMTKIAAIKLSSFARRINCMASYRVTITSKFGNVSVIQSRTTMAC
jgi:hypothetical protein